MIESGNHGTGGAAASLGTPGSSEAEELSLHPRFVDF